LPFSWAALSIKLWVIREAAQVPAGAQTGAQIGRDAIGDPSVVGTRYWTALADGRLQCDVCPRRCRLADGQRGLCFVRGRLDDRVVLTTWGRSSGFCVDPIEKKPLSHFLPGTPVLSFGTAGCNLFCRFCQNWDISKSRELDTLQERATPEQIAATAERLGCRSVAFTYNDPVIFLEYAVDVSRACRERDLRSVAVTAGYVEPEPRRDFFAAIDAANVDLKAFSERFYREVCSAELAPVLDTLVYLRHETDVWLEVTTLLIPGENDSDAELEAMAGWLAERLGPDVPWHLTAFHPDFKMTDKTRTPRSTLDRARRIGLRAGMHHVYTGNVHDPEGQSTWCHACGERLIGRDGYQLTDWQLDASGACRACGARCPGVFEAAPGDWGARRLPVRPSSLVAAPA
jgi:pyruvate formate lyase activating enzyme